MVLKFKRVVIMAVIFPLSLGVNAIRYEKFGLVFEINTSSNTCSVVDAILNCFSEIEIPSSIEYEGVEYPVTSIGRSAFLGKDSVLTSITIPESVTVIEGYNFNFTNLERIVLKCDTVSIHGGVFFGTKWFDNFPDGPVIIGRVLYRYKGDIPSSYIVPDTIVKIAGEAFANQIVPMHGIRFPRNNYLTSIDIPESVTWIGDKAFYYCDELSSVTIRGNISRIENGTFTCCVMLSSFTIPESVRYIGAGAFCETGLSSIILPPNLEKIDTLAFGYCDSLSSITIPQSVVEIGLVAFANSHLESIYFLNSTPPILGDQAIDRYCSLYVPEGSFEAYRSATAGWGYTFNIMEFDPTGVDLIVSIIPDVFSSDGVIRVSGAGSGAVISLYGVTGELLYKGTDTTIPVSGSGLYIVKVNEFTRKVVL